MSSYVKVYIQTFNSSLDYTGEFVEVTEDIDIRSIGKVKQSIEGSEFDAGIFKYSNFKITLRNDHGKYSEPGVLQSIFTDKRIDSIVKVTWSGNDDGPICGIAICGEEFLGDDVNVFYGLLNDSSSSQDIRDNKITFSVQGLESIFDKVETNYSSLSAGDTLSTTIYNVLNQSGITALMTVDASNISVDEDQIPDTIADLEETTVKEALDLLLAAGNAVLYVTMSDQTVYVKARTPTAAVQKTFYGQASNNGSEDIVDLQKITVGINRMFNFLKWEDTTITYKDVDSISNFGVRKKEIGNDLFTDTTKRTNILTAYGEEFSTPKKELMLTSVLDYETADLFMLDRVEIDYPTVFYSADGVGEALPTYGISVYGTARLPYGTWSLTLDSTTNFKIIGRTLDLKKKTVEYKLREI